MAENEVQMIVSGGVRYRPEDAKELKLKADPKPERVETVTVVADEAVVQAAFEAGRAAALAEIKAETETDDSDEEGTDDGTDAGDSGAAGDPDGDAGAKPATRTRARKS